MRFLFVAPRYHTNQNCAIRSLIKAGHDVKFIVLEGEPGYEVLNKNQRIEMSASLTPQVMGISGVFRWIARNLGKEEDERFINRRGFPPFAKLLKDVRSFNPDVLVVRNPSTVLGILSIVTAKLQGANIVFYTQGAKYREISFIKRALRVLPAKVMSAQWVTPVLGDPESCSEFYEKVHYIPFPLVTRTSPEKKKWYRSDCINLISVARFEARKKHSVLIEAIRRLKEVLPIKATIIGRCTSKSDEKYLKSLKKKISLLKLSDIVKIRVNISHEEVHKEYPKHDIFVLASRNERAAVSHLEAMSHSVPAICTDTNGTKCYIENGYNGFVVNTDSVGDLVDKMKKAVNIGLKKMGKNSFKTVKNKHNPSMYVRSMEKVASG